MSCLPPSIPLPDRDRVLCRVTAYGEEWLIVENVAADVNEYVAAVDSGGEVSVLAMAVRADPVDGPEPVQLIRYQHRPTP